MRDGVGERSAIDSLRPGAKTSSPSVRLRYPRYAFCKKWCARKFSGYIRCDKIVLHDSTIPSFKRTVSLVACCPSIMGARESYYLLECGFQ